MITVSTFWPFDQLNSQFDQLNWHDKDTNLVGQTVKVGQAVVQLV